MNRLHHEDMRCIIAAIQLPHCEARGEWSEEELAVRSADKLLDYIEGVYPHIKPEPRPAPAPVAPEIPEPRTRGEWAGAHDPGDFSTVPFETYQRDVDTLHAKIDTLRAESERLEMELSSVDSAIGNRSAFDGLTTRFDKINMACRLAERTEKAEERADDNGKLAQRMADQASENLKLYKAEKEHAERAEGEIRHLKEYLDKAYAAIGMRIVPNDLVEGIKILKRNLAQDQIEVDRLREANARLLDRLSGAGWN